MKKDAIKNYIVSINGGSGVIFQPGDTAHTYILTAKHIFADINEYGNKVHIVRYDTAKPKGIKVRAFSLDPNKNYFIHEQKDICILKVNRIPGGEDLLRLDDFDKYSEDAFLFGFPGIRRDAADFLDRMREDPILSIGNEKGNGLREAILKVHANYDELKGQSGGGLFCEEGDYFGLIGIQNRIPEGEEDLGRLDFTPLTAFDEVIQIADGKLEPIAPPYLKEFKFLLPGIFNIQMGLDSKDAGEKITKVLRKAASNVAKSDITPVYIREFFREKLAKEKLLLLHNQGEEELDKRKIWSIWLEFLTILNMSKEKIHCQGDCGDIFKNVRLFYSDTDQDFWLEHIHDLARTDYSGLKDKGLVVVASNREAQDNRHILKIDRIPGHIGELKKIHEEHQLEIDKADEFPFEKYQFANISAFKEDPVKNKFGEFAGMDFPKVTEHLKKLYEQLLD